MKKKIYFSSIFFVLFFAFSFISLKVEAQNEGGTAKDVYLFEYPCPTGYGHYKMCNTAHNYTCSVSEQYSCGGGGIQ